MKGRMTGAATVLIVVIFAAACAPDSDPGGTESDTRAAPQHQIRDSAGTRIIENRRPADGSRLGWEIGTQPTVSIGSVEGTEAFQLHRVDDALKLDDGRLVVANGGSHQLLVFDEAGNYQTAWGQKGEGPGDFGGF